MGTRTRIISVSIFTFLGAGNVSATNTDPDLHIGEHVIDGPLHIGGKLTQPDEAAIDGTCSMVSRKSRVAMTWDAEWDLIEDELWILDNGYIDGETLFQGRADH